MIDNDKSAGTGGFGRDSHQLALRVATTEVRLFPLTPIGSPDRYPQLDQLLADLSHSGIRGRIVEVAYEFQAGAHEMLVCEMTT
ncbi:hypothetical protein [Nocardia salmonicida]|uniref:hypothetical protein n=1 Tax=Nocardia salmonicida TaxID=53431 RepID=UPI003417BEB7